MMFPISTCRRGDGGKDNLAADIVAAVLVVALYAGLLAIAEWL